MVAAYARRIHRPPVWSGRIRAFARGTDRSRIDGLAGISPTGFGGHSAVDRGDLSFPLFPLEVARLAGGRYLADLHLAVWICRRRHQSFADARGALAAIADPLVVLVGEGGDRLGRCLRRRRVFLLRRGAL